MIARDAQLLGGDVSILSWNILAEDCTTGSVDACVRYGHVPPEDLAWQTRYVRVLEEVIATDADILCFQEVSLKTEADIRAPLEAAGYAVLLQQKNDTKHPTVNATFWKKLKFEFCSAVHRSRVLTTVLKDSNDRWLAVANCHLEGNPRESVARVKQLQSSLKQLQSLQHHAVIFVGDFNCELQTSACASYLAFGMVIPGVIEWGREVPAAASEVPGHGYELSSAYANDGDDISFNIRGGRGVMLDQLWHSHNSLRLVARRSVFRSNDHKAEILACGLPSARNPSDHLPIGAVLEWVGVLSELGREAAPSPAQPVDLLEEVGALLANCPWTDEQRSEWEVATTLPELPKKQKPSTEQLQVIKELRERRDRLLAELPEEARQILERVVELQKKLKKAAPKP